MKYNLGIVMSKKQSGFTLVELSIVLVIIGLIVAGVVVGQSLVQQTKLRSVVTDVEKLKINFNTFRLQYGALPGDMSNAMDYWGAACGTSTNITNVSPFVNGELNGRCNGNKNKYIEWPSFEILKAFQQMSLANIIPSSYSGDNIIPSGSSNDGRLVWVPGTNIPKAPFGDLSGYLLFNDPVTTPQNVIALGRVLSNSITMGSIITTQDAQSIDSKLDDSLATSGYIIAKLSVDGGDCLDGNKYKLTNTAEKQCRLFFRADM